MAFFGSDSSAPGDLVMYGSFVSYESLTVSLTGSNHDSVSSALLITVAKNGIIFASILVTYGFFVSTLTLEGISCLYGSSVCFFGTDYA